MTSASSGMARLGADFGDLAVVDQHVDLVALAVKPHSTKQHTHATYPFPAEPLGGRLGAHQQMEQHRHPDVDPVGNLLQHR